jgi:hypothetical protein
VDVQDSEGRAGEIITTELKPRQTAYLHEESVNVLGLTDDEVIVVSDED